MLSFVEDEQHELDEAESHGGLLPYTPQAARRATHNYTPAPKENAVRGRVFDHKRERSPVTLSTPFESSASKWQRFVLASHGRHHTEGGHVVDQSWLNEHYADLEKPSPSTDEVALQQNKRFLVFTSEGRALLKVRIRVCCLRTSSSRYSKTLTNL